MSYGQIPQLVISILGFNVLDDIDLMKRALQKPGLRYLSEYSFSPYGLLDCCCKISRILENWASICEKETGWKRNVNISEIQYL